MTTRSLGPLRGPTSSWMADLRACLTSSFAPFGRSGRVTLAMLESHSLIETGCGKTALSDCVGKVASVTFFVTDQDEEQQWELSILGVG